MHSQLPCNAAMLFSCYSCYTPCSIACLCDISVNVNILFGHEQRLRRWQCIVPTLVGTKPTILYVGPDE